MAEISIASVHSAVHRRTVDEQPTRFSRWWTRHYFHIGLASMAGSAILICVIAVMLLPIALHKVDEDDNQCSSEDPTWFTKPSIPFIMTTTTARNVLLTTTPKVPSDPLCAVNVTWKSRAVTIAGSSNGTTSLLRANLNSPNDIFLDADGNLFVADSNNNRIAYWSINAIEGCIVAGTGVLGSWSNLLKYPAAVTAWNDQLYVSDRGNYRLLVFPLSRIEDAPDGITLVGRYGAGSALNQINSVYFIAIDTVRELFYLSDSGNHRILKLNLTDDTLQLVAVTGMADSTNISLNCPLGITIDETTGSLYIADSGNHRIQKFNFNDNQGITVAGGTGYGNNLSQLYLPSGVAIDAIGNIYIADTGNNRIVQWIVGARQGRIIAGTGIAGSSDSQLNNPVQMKFDRHYNLYIVDQNNNRIQRFDLLYNGC